jgi:hypothetical protein
MTTTLWIIVAIIAAPTLYGLHRFCLLLDDYGYLIYRKRPGEKRRGGGGSMFLPLDQIMRPQIQHVIQVKEQHEKVTEEKDGDQNHPQKANMP